MKDGFKVFLLALANPMAYKPLYEKEIPMDKCEPIYVRMSPSTTPITTSNIEESVEKVVTNNKIPLIVDQSGRGIVDLMFSYQPCVVLDTTFFVQDSLKNAPLEETLETARQKLVEAMKQGQTLVIMLKSFAPDFKSKFTSPTHFPMSVFKAGGLMKQSEANLVFRPKDLEGGLKEAVVRDGFRVVLTTQLPLEKLDETLEDFLPLQNFQVLDFQPQP